MDFHTLSDPQFRLQLVLWAALLALGLVFVLIALTFSARKTIIRRRLRQERVDQTWRPVTLLLLSIGRLPASMPELTRKDVLPFAHFWLEQLNSVEGDSRKSLLSLALQLGLPEKTRRYLHSRLPSASGKRVTAIRVAGYCRDERAIPALLRALHATEATLAFAAAVALIRIHPETCGLHALKEAFKRHWAAPYVAKILMELQRSSSPAQVQHILEELPPKQVRTMLKAWASVDDAAAEQFARQVLLHPGNEGWLLCGALEVLRNPHDVSLARTYLSHQLWGVRVQAINAMSRLGLRHDIAQLDALANDEMWWVRERAKEALHTHQLIKKEDSLNA